MFAPRHQRQEMTQLGSANMVSNLSETSMARSYLMAAVSSRLNSTEYA
jgi:hypothetical protein